MMSKNFNETEIQKIPININGAYIDEILISNEFGKGFHGLQKMKIAFFFSSNTLSRECVKRFDDLKYHDFEIWRSYIF